MSLGGLGLALERPELAADLAQQVLHAQEVRLGRVESAFGLLLALAELEDTRRLFDDRPPVLRTGVENAIDLALADDHVLLPADARVGEQFLHVEQTTRCAVDRVLGLAATEQCAGDHDLAQFDSEHPVGVVDGDRHLGASERRSRRRAGEDDVVHLLTPHRLGGLGAEHPGDGVDDVRLARSVRADHDGDAGLERQGRALGKRLETLEGETFQEHGNPEDIRAPAAHTGMPLIADRPGSSGCCAHRWWSVSPIPGHT